ncbi:MAG: hypothetical protein NE334_17730 [Lentisphaeraceae bacterium]|nr:hypothetical protein [Lentisphaeraceae bacterium]
MKYILILFFSISLTAAENVKSEKFSYKRVFKKAKASPSWPKDDVQDQILFVRKLAAKEKTVSDPVSDRYTLTAYGGPIDLVHFLMLAYEATRDEINIKDRLYKEWVSEGGPDHQFGFNPKYPCEAHPDDLPSNALGGLFGTEIKHKMKKEDFDLFKEFSKFIEPLKPLPDRLAQKFSHRSGVMGLRVKETFKLEQTRYIWFTAEPLNQTGLINAVALRVDGKKFCKTLKTGTSCLREAGFTLRKYRGKTILVQRY